LAARPEIVAPARWNDDEPFIGILPHSGVIHRVTQTDDQSALENQDVLGAEMKPNHGLTAVLGDARWITKAKGAEAGDGIRITHEVHAHHAIRSGNPRRNCAGVHVRLAGCFAPLCERGRTWDECEACAKKEVSHRASL